MTESNVSAEQLADTLKRVQEILDYFDAEANEALAGETERGDLWSDIDIPVADLRTLIAAAKVRAIREDDGEWVMVPREPTARVIAAAFVQTQEPSDDDLKIARQALVLLPSSPVEKVTEALADLSRDYRAMIAASPIPATTGGVK